MTERPDDRRVVVPGGLVTWDEIGGEIVAIHLATGHYHSLRDTARDVFVALAAGASLGSVADQVGVGADPATVRDELDRFVADLLRAGLVVEAPDSGVGAEPAGDGAGPEPSGRPYSAPVLETFTDLEDLMLLDPVHDVDDQGWPRADLDA